MNKKALHKISYGMYILCSKNDEKFNGQIVNSVIQTTAEPPMVAVCVNKKNLTHEFIESSKVFTLSVLSTDTPMNLIGTFGYKSGRYIDKFGGINFKIGAVDVPIVLNNAIGYIECKLVDTVDVGTHSLFIGIVVDADILSDAEPMTYAYYHTVKGGVSPKNAPTYIEGKEKGGRPQGDPKMKKYRCTVCGYIYDPKLGDPNSGIQPGTPFEALPDTWVCPVCGVEKSDFEEV